MPEVTRGGGGGGLLKKIKIKNKLASIPGGLSPTRNPRGRAMPW